MMKSSFIVLLGLACTALMRRRSAAVRHWVLASALACSAATPALELIVPVWHVPMSLQMLGGRRQPLALLVPVSAGKDAEGANGAQPAGASPVRAAAGRWLWRGWLAGVCVNLLVLLAGIARLARLASRSRQVAQGTWAGLAGELARRLGLAGPVALLQSDHPLLLVTWGFRRPKIMLPRTAGDWPADRAAVVLGHELAHIRRRDWAIQLLASVLRSVYWFNPLFWIACRRLRQESEQACDDEVLGLGVQGPDYAGHLLDLARTFERHRRPLLPAPAMARRSNLERRVRAMLNAGLNRAPLGRSACLVTVVALLGIAVPIAGLVAAQTTAASFTGSLLDPLNRTIPDVPLSMTSVENGKVFATRSDQAGRFAFSSLPAGEYALQVQHPGFATVKTRLTLAAGQNLQQDVALQIALLRETITIRADAGRTAATDAPRPRQMPERALRPPQDDPCSASGVGGCITAPLKLADFKPRYPEHHAANGVSGTVHLQGRLDTNGLIIGLEPASGDDPDFVSATIDAVRQWRFTSTKLDGVPVEARIAVTVYFEAK